MGDNAAAPWHAAYPKPRNGEPESLACQDLLKRFTEGQTPGVDFLLVDLRRTDHEVSGLSATVPRSHKTRLPLPCRLERCLTVNVPGWHNPRLDQSPSSESIRQPSYTLQPVPQGEDRTSNLVLR